MKYYERDPNCKAKSGFDDDCTCWREGPPEHGRLAVRHDISHGGEAAIDRGYHWLPIDANTPRGVKLQLINKRYGVATYGQIFSDNCFWTHYALLPTFKKE